MLAPASRDRRAPTTNIEAAGHWPAAFLFAAVFLCFAAGASFAALNKGPWLDEFWSFYLTDPDLPLSRLLSERWLQDTHPVLPNMLYFLVRSLGAEDPGSARLLLNLPALAALGGATFLFFRAAERRRSFYPIFAALVLGLPDSILFVSEYRSYFWQIAVFAVAVQYVHYSLAEAEREMRPGWLSEAVGLGAVLLSLSLHFITSAIVSPFYLLAALALFLHGHRPAAFRLGGALALGWAILLPLAALQYSQGASDLDVRWITTTTGQALWLAAGNLGSMARSAVLPIALLLFLGIRRMRGGSRAEDAGPRDLAILILRAVLIGAIGLLVLNALQPILVSRYFLPWQVMAVAAIAALCSAALSRRILLIALTGLWSIAGIALHAHEQAGQRRWHEGLEAASRIMAACPGTRLFATSHWRFTQHRNSRTADKESRVVGHGYRSLAAEAGVPLNLLDHRSPVSITPSPACPTLIWVQHFTVGVVPSRERLLAQGGITLAGPAPVSIVPSSEDSTLFMIGRGR